MILILLFFSFLMFIPTTHQKATDQWLNGQSLVMTGCWGYRWLHSPLWMNINSPIFYNEHLLHFHRKKIMNSEDIKVTFPNTESNPQTPKVLGINLGLLPERNSGVIGLGRGGGPAFLTRSPVTARQTRWRSDCQGATTHKCNSDANHPGCKKMMMITRP